MVGASDASTTRLIWSSKHPETRPDPATRATCVRFRCRRSLGLARLQIGHHSIAHHPLLHLGTSARPRSSATAWLDSRPSGRKALGLPRSPLVVARCLYGQTAATRTRNIPLRRPWCLHQTRKRRRKRAYGRRQPAGNDLHWEYSGRSSGPRRHRSRASTSREIVLHRRVHGLHGQRLRK